MLDRPRIADGRTRRIAARLVLAVALLAGVMSCRPAEVKVAPPTAPAGQKTVALTIDFGNGRRRDFADLAWRDGMTVADLLGSAEQAGLKVERRGSGATSFVEAIGAVRNAGIGAGNRNWLFFVNGRKGREGAGATQLQPGDRVLWKYTTEQ